MSHTVKSRVISHARAANAEHTRSPVIPRTTEVSAGWSSDVESQVKGKEPDWQWMESDHVSKKFGYVYNCIRIEYIFVP